MKKNPYKNISPALLGLPKYKVYEFCGYVNTPDECAGAWFQESPHPVTPGAEKPTPRVSFYDRAAGVERSSNWRVYFVTLQRDTALAGRPTVATRIVSLQYERHETKGILVRPWTGETDQYPYCAHAYWIPCVEEVSMFFDAEGNVIEVGHSLPYPVAV